MKKPSLEEKNGSWRYRRTDRQQAFFALLKQESTAEFWPVPANLHPPE
ncbi:hypothetical protein [Brenneria goodwinii]|nr:hypothetical protein [Brenneria goodwinii]